MSEGCTKQIDAIARAVSMCSNLSYRHFGYKNWQ